MSGYPEDEDNGLAACGSCFVLVCVILLAVALAIWVVIVKF